MATRKVKGEGLWHVKTKKDSPESESPPPQVAKAGGSQEQPQGDDGTLYSFTFRLELEERNALDRAGRSLVRKTAPGKGQASAVLRELIRAWMESREPKIPFQGEP